MRLAVIGTGYVGLVAGVCFAEAGNDVICVDVDQDKLARLQAGELTIYEPGLERLFERNLREERLCFTSDLAHAVQDSEVIFLALPTPPAESGAADLSYILQAAEDIGRLLQDYKVIVTKSTVPVGTADAVQEHLARHAQAEFDVVSNPEFLREGVAVDDFLKPERVVIGTSSPRAERVMRELYHPFLMSGNPLLVMDTRSAELTKYAANSMLAMRISFMNDIANLCDQCGADVDRVRLGMGLDSRIGKRFLFAGIGYGGSCFLGEETVFSEQHQAIVAQRFATFFDTAANAPGTVLTQEGEVEIATPVGQNVLAFDLETGQPTLAPVAAVTRRPYNGSLVQLTTSMGRSLQVTADHPVILHKPAGFETVPAATVKGGDKILALCALPAVEPIIELNLLELLRDTALEASVYVAPRDDAFTRQYSQFAASIPTAMLRYPHEIKRHNRMSLRLLRHLREQGVLQVEDANLQLYTAKGAATKINAVIPVDADLLRLCGYYLAEGYISQETRRAGALRERIGFCFHENELEYITDTQRILRRWGLKFIERNSTHATTTVVSSRLFAWLLRDVLGSGTRSENKALPTLAFNVSPALRFELLRGAFSGDGAVTTLQKGRNLMLEYATVSKLLADGLALLLQTLEIVPSVRQRWMNKSTQPAYLLRVSGYAQVQTLQNVFGDKRLAHITSVLAGYQRQIQQSGFERRPGYALLTVGVAQQEQVQTTVYSMETGTGTLIAASGLVCHNCFPKDVKALIWTGREFKAPQRLLEATEEVNQNQKLVLLPRLLEHYGNDLAGRKFALWGLSFKPNTDDIREAPALTIINALLERGAQVCAYDPEGMNATRRILGERITYAKRHYEACEGADALIIATEWNKFREPDFSYLRELLHEPVIFDGRNLYELETMREHGFTYYSIGRPMVRAAVTL